MSLSDHHTPAIGKASKNTFSRQKMPIILSFLLLEGLYSIPAKVMAFCPQELHPCEKVPYTLIYPYLHCQILGAHIIFYTMIMLIQYLIGCTCILSADPR